MAFTICLLVSICGEAAAAGAPPLVAVFQTTHALSQRLTQLPSTSFETPLPDGLPVIRVDDRLRYQRIFGVGAAMTDSSAWLIYDQLPAQARDAALSALFGPGGIRLNFIRVPMGASDFTATERPYTYDDVRPGSSDPALKHFSIAHDRGYILPALREALALNPRAAVIATPWSPPAWMKTNGVLANRGNAAALRPSAYGSLARYFVKFVKAYARAGVPIAGVTPQNEPAQGTAYPGMSFPEPAEARFVTRFLGPALRAAGLRTQIYGFDYSWSATLAPYVRTLVHSRARGVLAGIAFHCYGGEPTAMTQLHRLAPHVPQLVSECSSGSRQVWFPAELEISSLRNWASAVALWNLALDRAGGPVQPPNSGCRGCTGVVTVDVRSRRVAYGLPYYQLGHVSRFLEPGAVRVYSNHFVTYSGRGASAGLDDVAFVNPDGSEVLVAYDNARRPIRFAVRWRGMSFSYTLPAGAMATFLWRSG